PRLPPGEKRRGGAPRFGERRLARAPRALGRSERARAPHPPRPGRPQARAGRDARLEDPRAESGVSFGARLLARALAVARERRLALLRRGGGVQRGARR